MDAKLDGPYTHLVVIVREQTPEVTPFRSYDEAADFFETASLNWSESFLTAVVVGPGLPKGRVANRCAAAETALAKISAIRDSIVGLQKVNWSEHIYPLVAALGEAGYEGAGYEIARPNFGTLFDRCNAAETKLARVRSLYKDYARPWMSNGGSDMSIALEIALADEAPT